NCAIKGNISRSGEKVYHLPGSRDYARTVIDEKAGERMFCSEDEAKAAGWRAPRG
ncbi:thermonuclease family protein, partial [Methylobacterium hispanicum]